MKKAIPWVLAATLLIAAVYFFVLLVDAGISIDGARTRADRLQGRSELSLYFLKKRWVGESRAEVMGAAKELEQKDVIVKNYSDVIEVGDIIFDISNDKVSDIRYMD
jgi:hypothetical protein